ncbi:MAG TPA: DUF1015 domain-containing protein [Clostridiaceae bacterium]|nr:DUF1015 domain-containing protein [Clostridiaceae bacterium]
MKELQKVCEKIGMHIPEILLPSKNINLMKWSVVACDQYTSQPEYWKEVEKIVDESPSTLHLIFPEAYLEDGDADLRIEKINSTMEQYLKDNILASIGACLIYVERETSRKNLRKGLIAAVDLEKYDYYKGAQSLIRTTEETVLERIPPRVKIRQNAPIELPHVMLLIDDPDKTVIEPLAEKTGNLEKLYDFNLMMNGGHIKGYKISDEETILGILEALENLGDKDKFTEKYDIGPDKGVMLFAVGDGNHSLASAKAHWEKVKAALPYEKLISHPARYALVEIVNVHDSGLSFEPIHRVVFNVKAEELLNEAINYFDAASGASVSSFYIYKTKEHMESELINYRKRKDVHAIPFVSGKNYGIISVANPVSSLEVGTLQPFLDEFVKKNNNVKIDYIHGDETVTSLGSQDGNIGFYLPPMDKHDLFKTVILDGALPRKTFSMGEAEEKRFYLECRKIR